MVQNKKVLLSILEDDDDMEQESESEEEQDQELPIQLAVIELHRDKVYEKLCLKTRKSLRYLCTRS